MRIHRVGNRHLQALRTRNVAVAGLYPSAEHFALGLLSCFLTEVILKYVIRMPRSYDRGVSYIISRNLRPMYQHTIGVAAHLSLPPLCDE